MNYTHSGVASQIGQEQLSYADLPSADLIKHRNFSTVLHLEITMSTEVVNGWAVKQLRELYRLNRHQAASLCGLNLTQLTQLEEGGHDSFASPADKIQAAMRFAGTLSGKQSNGLPKANVFYVGNSPVLGNRYTARPDVMPKQERFIDSPKFLKSVLITFVMLFLLFGVATPILFGKKSAPYLDGVPVIEKLPVIK